MLHPLEIEIQKLEEVKKKLEIDIFDLESKVPVIEKQIKEASAELENFQSAGREAHAQLVKVSERVTGEIASLNLKVSDKQAELAELEKAIAEKTDEITSVSIQSENAQSLFAQMKSKLQTEIDLVMIDRAKLGEECATLEKQKKDIEYSIGVLQGSIEANKAKADEFVSLVEAKQKELEEVSEKYNLVASLVEKETNNVSLLKKQSVDNVGIIDTQKQEIAKLISEIETLTKQRNDKEKDILAIGIREKNVDEKEKTLKEFYQRAGVEYPQS